MNRMFRQRKYDTRRIDRQYAEETDVYVMLYNSYADALYAYGMGFGFDNETVKDVIHDIFLDIMTRQVDLGRIVNIKAYLFRIVHNRLVDLHHRLFRHRFIDSQRGNRRTPAGNRKGFPD